MEPQVYSLTDELARVSTEKDEWHIEHQGPLVDIIGEVWWCGDEWCDCTEPQIVARFRNLADHRFIVPRSLWHGTFRSQGEAGAGAELADAREWLEAAEPEMAERITWRLDA